MATKKSKSAQRNQKSLKRESESSMHTASITANNHSQGSMKSKSHDCSPRLPSFDPQFLEDLEYWVSRDTKKAKKVLKLAKASLRDPFTGEGHPEPLKYLGSDIWSRRISEVDRLVYMVEHNVIHFLQARYHYS